MMKISMDSLRDMEALAYRHMDRCGYTMQDEMGVYIDDTRVYFKAYGTDENGIRHEVIVHYFEGDICRLTDEMNLGNEDLENLGYYEEV